MFTVEQKNCGFISRELKCSINKTKFKVQVWVKETSEELLIQFPLFNFDNKDPGYLYIKPLCGTTRSKHTLACNDQYLTSFSFQNIPNVLPVLGYQLKTKKKGAWIIKALLSTGASKIPAGNHAIHSTLVRLKKQCKQQTCDVVCADRYNEHSEHLFYEYVMDSNFFPLQTNTLQVNAHVSRNSQDRQVRIKLDSFTFTTTADIAPEDFNGVALLNVGGYLSTSANLLENQFVPAQAQTQLVLVNNGTLGINVSIDYLGRLIVQSSNIFGGTLPVGVYTVPELEFTYYQFDYEAQHNTWFENQIVDQKFSTFQEFQSNPTFLRDSHVNDFDKGVAAFSWSGNQKGDFQDPQNVFFAKYQNKDEHFVLKIPAKQITNFTNVGDYIFDTSVAINRGDSDNIVVGYSTRSRVTNTITFDVQVSIDGGQTFSLVNILTTPRVGIFRDARGVLADKYGNFLFCLAENSSLTVPGNTVINASFYASADKGFTWTLVYKTSLPQLAQPAPSGIDYTQFFVGKGPESQYGIYWVGSQLDANIVNANGSSDYTPIAGFIPIFGLGQYGTTSTNVTLSQYQNEMVGNQVTVNNREGQGYYTAYQAESSNFTNYWSNLVMLKHPGSWSSDNFGPIRCILNTNQNLVAPPQAVAYDNGFFSQSVQGCFFDNRRNLLYSMYIETILDNSADINIFMVVSFDEGRSWSAPIFISTSSRNNRGYPSMWLDSHTGSLSVGFYDSRQDPTGTMLQYWLAFIPSCRLDQLLKSINCKWKC